MTRPTKYDVMRRNWQKLERARKYREADAAWKAHRERLKAQREEDGQETVQWIAETREEARRQVTLEPEPGMVRVLLHMLRGLPSAIWRAVTHRATWA